MCFWLGHPVYIREGEDNGAEITQHPFLPSLVNAVNEGV